MTPAGERVVIPDLVAEAGLLEIRGLAVGYRSGAAVLADVDLTVRRGEVVALVGASGSGKSTLAQVACGLLPRGVGDVSGSVLLCGTELVGLGERARSVFRGRRVGLVPQDPGISLDPTMMVGRQVAEVLRVHGTGRAAAIDRAVEMLGAVGLHDPERRARQYPHELSGGMRQRVLVAMATACDPDLLVADEATSALDPSVARHVADLLVRSAGEAGRGVLMITHDLRLAAERAARVVVLAEGRIVEQGVTARVLENPEHPATRALLRGARRRPGRLVTRIGTRDAGPTAAVRPSPSDAPLLRGRGLRRAFPLPGAGASRAGGTQVAVDDVSFEIAPATTLGLLGESGSGKTTVARLVLGLERPDAGAVTLRGEDVSSASPRRLRTLRRSLQMVHQNPHAALHPRFSVATLVAEPLRNHHIGDGPARARRVAGLLDEVGLAASTATRRAGELSGGECQRVAIARALALAPDVLVCDESVSALDAVVGARVLRLLAELQDRWGLAYLFITHDLEALREISDQVAVLRAGRVVESGATSAVLDAPRHPYTQELVAAAPGTFSSSVTDGYSAGDR